MTAKASTYNTSTHNSNIFSFQSVSRTKETNNPAINVFDWLQGHDAVQLEGEGAFGFNNFPGSNKSFQAIYFSLKGNIADHYALFRGIVRAGQPKEIYLEDIHETRSFTLKFYKKNEDVAKRYLEKIFKIVNDEIRFKQVLRKVILNQEKHRMEEKLLFSELNRSH